MKIEMNTFQKEAYNSNEGRIVVLAGAGSGKTKVLTERAKRLIVEKKATIESLLVLTFTKKAALEMKERIYRSLSQDDSVPQSLKETASLIYSANITTFDAYFLNLLNTYSYRFGITKKVTPVDENFISLKKREFLEEILSEYYENPSDEFIKFVNKYLIKDDTKLFDYILRIDKALSLVFDKDEYLNEYLETKFEDVFIIFKWEQNIEIVKQAVKSFVKVLKEIDTIGVLEDYIYNLESFDELEDINLLTPPPSKLLSKELGKENIDLFNELITSYKKIKSKIEKFISDMSNEPKDVQKEYYNSTYSNVSLLLDITKELNRRITKFKEKNSIFTFEDIQRKALELVVDNKNSDIRKIISQNISYIMVDEYQDTSSLQDLFIESLGISNIFLVGDAKQSIYKFRNANVKNIIEKTNEKSGYKVIKMNENYRSNSTLISSINSIFSTLMSIQYGEVAYKENEELISNQRKTTSSDILPTNPPGLKFVPMPSKRQIVKRFDNQFEQQSSHENIISSNELTDEDEQVFNKQTLLETKQIIYDINSRMNNNEVIYDKTTSSYRKIKYSDFCILLDRKTLFDEINILFKDNHIPIIVEEDMIVSSSIVITALKTILNFIVSYNNNETSKYPHLYYSLARSFLYAYSDNDIYKTIKNNEIYTTKIFNEIGKISLLSNYSSLQELIIKIIDTFNFEEKILSIGNVEKENNLLEYFYNCAASYDLLSYGITDFIDFLEKFSLYDLELKNSNVKEYLDAVRLMTIHKSKGLEFNIIYYPGLSTGWKRPIENDFLVTIDEGIVLPFVYPLKNDDDLVYYLSKPYFMHTYTKSVIISKEISEKIRLLYVALTRACEEAIIFVDEEDLIFSQRNPDECSNFSSLLALTDITNIKNIMPLAPTFTANNLYKAEHMQTCEPIILTNLPSMKEPLLTKHVRASKEEKDIETSNPLLQKGILVHSYMEMIDFNTKDTSFIDDIELKIHLNYVLRLDILSNLKNAKIYKEYEFYDSTNNINGIIDLLIIRDDSISIIDYKYKHIDDPEYIKQLNVYSNYIKTKFDKPIKKYLISIVDEKYKEILD
ncbi:MAG: UvrD-helicase domain-containing protein [Acholeplasmatales bacterium]|jgi:ATP-dependent helicase/nuclease subunit A|nr:UvrD-helicase domain-containing protein [Acholeplasmatales bacterium]